MASSWLVAHATSTCIITVSATIIDTLYYVGYW